MWASRLIGASFRVPIAGLAAVQECLGAEHYPDISSDLAQVAELVLKDIQTPDFEFACAPCDAGIEILVLLQQAVFGSGSRGCSFMRCVQLASMSEVGTYGGGGGSKR